MAPSKSTRSRAHCDTEDLLEKKRAKQREYTAKSRANKCANMPNIECEHPLPDVLVMEASTRSIQRYVKAIYEDYFVKLSVDLQGQLLEGLFMHSELQNARILAGLSTSKETRASNIVIDNLSKALDTFKGSHTKDHEAARCTILTSVTTDDGFKESKLQRQASRLLGVSTKTLRKVSAKRASIMLTPNSLWAYTGRARRCDSLPMEARALCEAFWVENTRVCPDAKRAVRKRIGRGHRVENPLHYLEKSQTELYLEFCEANPNIHVGQRSFEYCKPWFVRRLDERNTCCCRSHIEMEYVFQAWQGFHKDFIRCTDAHVRIYLVCWDLFTFLGVLNKLIRFVCLVVLGI